MTEPGLHRFLNELQGAYLLKANPLAASAWHEALRYIGDSDAIAALRDHVREESRPPKPADIIRLAKNGPHSQVHQVGPDERLRRLNVAARQAISQRLASGDDAELRFQKLMLFHCAAAGLDADDEDYFRRVLGDGEVDAVLVHTT